MAQYEHLPIYKRAMDLAVYIETIVRGFPRYHKYTIGSEMRALSHKIPVLVVRANAESGQEGFADRGQGGAGGVEDTCQDRA